MGKRAVGVIVNNKKLLLIHRFKNDREYFVFPGGSIEPGETIENALIREMKEETGLDVEIDKPLFQIYNWRRKEYYFLIKKFSGVPALGCPEKERMNSKNQYYLIWVSLFEIANLSNLYPEEARKKF